MSKPSHIFRSLLKYCPFFLLRKPLQPKFLHHLPCLSPDTAVFALRKIFPLPLPPYNNEHTYDPNRDKGTMYLLFSPQRYQSPPGNTFLLSPISLFVHSIALNKIIPPHLFDLHDIELDKFAGTLLASGEKNHSGSIENNQF